MKDSSVDYQNKLVVKKGLSKSDGVRIVHVNVNTPYNLCQLIPTLEIFMICISKTNEKKKAHKNVPSFLGIISEFQEKCS